MNYRLIIILILAGYFISGVVNPTLRNYLRLEDNLGGFIVKKVFRI